MTTTRTRTPRTRKTATTGAAQRIPGDMMGVGFVAVAIRFPDPATAHRVVRVRLDDDEYPTGQQPPMQTRPACSPDQPARVFELSAETADARGAIACTDPACFGGSQ